MWRWILFPWSSGSPAASSLSRDYDTELQAAPLSPSPSLATRPLSIYTAEIIFLSWKSGLFPSTWARGRGMSSMHSALTFLWFGPSVNSHRSFTPIFSRSLCCAPLFPVRFLFIFGTQLKASRMLGEWGPLFQVPHGDWVSLFNGRERHVLKCLGVRVRTFYTFANILA